MHVVVTPDGILVDGITADTDLPTSVHLTVREGWDGVAQWLANRPILGKVITEVQDAVHMADIWIPRPGLRTLSLDSQWPWATLHFKWHGVTQSQKLSCHLESSRAARQAWATEVERLVTLIEAHFGRSVVDRGWLEHPILDFEEVDAWPTLDKQSRNLGYRENARPSAVATWRGGSSLWRKVEGYLMLGNAYRGLPPLPDLALTREHVYTRDKQGHVKRIARASLRATHDHVAWVRYVFGRNTEVDCLRSSANKVARELDRQLKGRSDAFGAP